MRIEVVHHQRDPFRMLVLPGYLFKKSCPVMSFSACCYPNHPFSCQRFIGHKNITGSSPAVFVIISRKLACSCRYWYSFFSNQLLWRLIHTDYRVEWVIRLLIHVQHHLHVSHKITVAERRNHPSFLLPRLKDVFFSTLRTVS